jgi:RHS repeat-associated protein
VLAISSAPRRPLVVRFPSVKLLSPLRAGLFLIVTSLGIARPSGAQSPPSFSPASKTITVTPPVTNGSVTMTVINNSFSTASIFLTASCSGMVTQCSMASPAPGQPLSLGAGQNAVVTVSYSASTGTQGTIIVGATDASNGAHGQGTITVNAAAPPPPQVAVTPKGTAATRAANGSFSQDFFVSNPGTAPTTYTVTGTCTNAVSCNFPTQTFTLNGGAQQLVTVGYTTNASGGSGTVQLTASAPGVSDAASLAVTVTPPPVVAVQVGPKGSAVSFNAGSPQTLSFAVRNAGNVTTTYNLALTCSIACNALAAPTLTLDSGVVRSVDVQITAGTGNVQLTATNGSTSDAGSFNVTALAPGVVVFSSTPTQITQPAGATATQTITVRNTGNLPTPTTYTITSQCTGAVSCVPLSTSVSLASGTQQDYPITYTTSSAAGGGSGTVQLSANGGGVSGAASIAVAVTPPTFGVVVTPIDSAVAYPSGSSQTLAFTVRNTSSVQNIFTLTPSCPVTCSASAGSVTLNPGISATVTVTLGTTTGPVHLVAAGTGASATGTYTMTALVPGVAVTPKGLQVTKAAGAPGTQLFTVRNTGTLATLTTYTITGQCTGTVSCTPLSTTTTLASGASQDFTINYTASSTVSGGSGTVQLSATGGGVSDQASLTVTVAPLPVVAVQVGPKGSAVSFNAGSPQTLSFAVRNAGNVTTTYNLALVCQITCGSLATTTLTLDSGVVASVPVQITAGTGSVQLTASNGATSDVGSFNVTALAPGLVVFPKGLQAATAAGTTATQTFTVKNAGNLPTPTVYTVTGQCLAGAVSCTSFSTSVSLISGAQQDYPITYTTSAVPGGGSGTVRVSASGGGLSDSASLAVTVPPPTFGVVVTPSDSAVAFPAGSSQTLAFTVRNTSSVQNIFTLTSSCPVSCSVSVSRDTLNPGATASVSVTTTAATGPVHLVAAGTGASATGTYTMTALVPGVAVTPKGLQVTKAAGASGTQLFTVRNTGTLATPTVYTIAGQCTATVSCTPLSTSVTLASGTQQDFTITYTASSTASGGSGTVQLSATGGSVSDQASLAVTVLPLPVIAVQVGPKSSAVSFNAGSPQTLSFAVRNAGNVTTTYNLALTCSIACNALATATLTLDSGVVASVPVQITAATGSVKLAASSGSASDTGSFNVTALAPGIVVFSTSPTQVTQPAGVTATQTITVRNTGNLPTPTTYTITSQCTGAVSCVPLSTSVSLASGAQQDYPITYSTSSAPSGGSGTVQLSASGGSVSGTVSIAVTVTPPTLVAVTPKNVSTSAAPSAAGTQIFTVRNPGALATTYTLAGTCTPSLTCTPYAGSLTLAASAQSDVSIPFTAGAFGTSGTVRLIASAGSVADTGVVTVTMPAGQVVVAPKGATVTQLPNANATQLFQITNPGTFATTYVVVASCIAPVTCSWNSTLFVPAGQTAQATVPYLTGAEGTGGTVQLTASGNGGQDVGSVNVTVPFVERVAVSPHVNASTVLANTTGTQQFTVSNQGLGTSTYAVSISCTGSVSCSVAPGSVTLAAAAQQTIAIPYAAGASGTGTIVLRAVSGAASDSGVATISLLSTQIAVTPKNGALTATVNVNTAQSFVISNPGSSSSTYAVSATCTGVVSCGAVSTSVTVAAGAQTTVSVPLSAPAIGTGTVRLRASSNGVADSGSVVVSVVAPPTQVVVTPKNGAALGYPELYSEQYFTVRNSGAWTSTYTITFACSGNTYCSGQRPAMTLASGAQDSVLVSYLTSNYQGPTGLVMLKASANGAADSGTVVVTLSTTQVAVTPKNKAVVQPANASVTTEFAIANTSTHQAAYTLSAICNGAVTCPNWSSSISVYAQQSGTVLVPYTTGASGTTGTVRLIAAYAGGADTGSVAVSAVTAAPTLVLVTPKGTTISAVPNGLGTQIFTVRNPGSTTTSYNLDGGCTGGADCGYGSDMTLEPGTQRDVAVTFGTGPLGTTGTVRLIARANGVADTGRVTVTMNATTVQVTPKGGTMSRAANSSSNQVFQIKNSSAADVTYTLIAGCTGDVSCSWSSTVFVPTTQTAALTVPYVVGGAGTSGSVRLTASSTGGEDVGSVDVTVPTGLQVAVSPHSGTLTQPGGTNGSQPFVISNPGTAIATYDVSATCTGATSCGVVTTPMIVPGGAQVTVNVPLSAAVSGTGAIRLLATVGDVSDSGVVVVTIGPPPPQVVVTPKNGVATHQEGDSSSQTFIVQNLTDSSTTYSLAVVCSTTLSCTAPSPSITVAPSAQQSVIIPYSALSRPWGTIVLRATSATASDSGLVGVTILLRPTVAVSPENVNVTAQPGMTNSQGFTYRNTGLETHTLEVTVACQGSVSCSFASFTKSLAPQESSFVSVNYTTGADGTGRVTFRARRLFGRGVADIDDAYGIASVTIASPKSFAVTPKDAAITPPAMASLLQAFTITNNGSDTTFALTAQCTEAVTCSYTSSRLVLAGASEQVNVPYTTLASGTGRITLTAARGAVTDMGSVNATLGAATNIVVEADTPAPTVPGGRTGQYAGFTIRNNGAIGARVLVQAACTGGGLRLDSCAPSMREVYLAGGANAPVRALFETQATGGSATTTLSVTDATTGALLASTNTDVTISAASSYAIVTVPTFDAGPNVDRSLCPTFAVVPSVAAQCGAIRVAHALPSIRTYGKSYTPMLAYYSDLVRGNFLLVDVALPPGAEIPEQVLMTVYEVQAAGNRVSVLTKPYAGTEWNTSSRARRLNTGSLGGSTGITKYEVEIKFLLHGDLVAAGDVQGEVAYLDRRGSAIGSGWGLLGLQSLTLGQSGGSIMWAGGDGSTRKYVPTAVGSTASYTAVSITRPDTLYFDGTEYRRVLQHGVNVYFDAYGRHVRTTDRLGRITTFTYVSTSTTLNTVTVPRPVSAPPAPDVTYTFSYGASALDITAPGGRVVHVNRVGQAVDNIVDPDNTTEKFEYTPGTDYALSAFTDRRGTKTTLGWEDAGRTLASASTPLSQTENVGLGLATAYGRGAAAAGVSADVASANYEYDGPRLDVLDSVHLWTSSYGGVTRSVDALGRAMTIEYGDPRFPGLTTRVVDGANGYETRASYDARGHLVATTSVNPHDDGKDATTAYEWDMIWDSPTKIIRPTGDFASMSYRPADGLLDWNEDARGAMSRTNYAYDDNKQLTSVAPPGVTCDLIGHLHCAQMEYDPILGNLATSWTPRGAKTTYGTDAIGRVRTTSEQLIFGNETTMRIESLDLDVMDRVRHSTTTGPARQAVYDPTKTYPALQVDVSQGYDAGGLLTRVGRTSTPDLTGVHEIYTRWDHDALGRTTVEYAPDATPDDSLDNPTTVTGYDPAGNVTTVRTRRQNTITMTYDALNRLKTRVVPAVSSSDVRAPRLHAENDYTGANCCNAVPQTYVIPERTDSYEYTSTGAMSVADNEDAHVGRSFYPNGQIEDDTLIIANGNRGDKTIRHRYVLHSDYRSDGQRQTLGLPASLVAGAGSTLGYSYNTSTGDLETITDPLNLAYTYGYDARRRTISLAFPGSYQERWGYDDDGNIAGDTLTNLGGTGSGRWGAGVLRSSVMTYDPSGRRLTTRDVSGFSESLDAEYDGLGHAMSIVNKGTGISPGYVTVAVTTTELSSYDALGNRYEGTDRANTNTTYSDWGAFYRSSSGENRSASFAAATGRLASDVVTGSGTTNYSYDIAGNTEFVDQRSLDVNDHWMQRFTYYGADEQIRAVDFRQVNLPHTSNAREKQVFDEYRYDALGRRIRVSSFHRCNDRFDDLASRVNACAGSVVRRTVWDGNQELMEIQAPAPPTLSDPESDDLQHVTPPGGEDVSRLFGRVLYIHGLGTDQPIGLVRYNYSDNNGTVDFSPQAVSLFWNTRGQLSLVACGTGEAVCRSGNVLMKMELPQFYFSIRRQTLRNDTWQGSLLQDKEDATGTLYRRNRAYDPKTGQFTQEDPIGLAGGLNAYGFAGGDPVNFSDPFGLCTKADGWKDCENMISALQGEYIVAAAVRSGEWTYSQHPYGGGHGMDPSVPKSGETLGDCTAFTLAATMAGVDDAGSLWDGGTKVSTAMFKGGNHPGYTEVEAGSAQAGDVVVQGGHAGIFLGKADGHVWGWANNGAPHKKDGTGYKDKDTGARKFDDGSFGSGDPRFYRPIN